MEQVERVGKHRKHPVWGILSRDKYIEESWSYYERLYDMIKDLVDSSGDTIIEGETVPVMKVFWDAWNENSSETFRILDRMVNSRVKDKKIDAEGLWRTMSWEDMNGDVPSDVEDRVDALINSGLLSPLSMLYIDLRHRGNLKDETIAKNQNFNSTLKVNDVRSRLALSVRRFVGDILFAKKFDKGKFSERVQYLRAGELNRTQGGLVIGIDNIVDEEYKGISINCVPFYELCFSLRTENALLMLGCRSIESVINLMENEMSDDDGIILGRDSKEEILSVLSRIYDSKGTM